MNVTLTLPDAVLDAASVPLERAESELLRELAVGLYTRGGVSAGKAAEIGGMKRLEFERLLCERSIVRNYSMEDLEHDLAWANAATPQ